MNYYRVFLLFIGRSCDWLPDPAVTGETHIYIGRRNVP